MLMNDRELQLLAKRVARLDAVDAILKVKHRYGELIDRLAERIDQNDLSDLANLFTEDVAIDFVTVQLEGRKGLLDLYGGQMQQNFSWLWHSFHSPVVDVDENNALARWTLQGMTIARDEAHPTTVYGRYIDNLVKIDGRWLISKLQLVIGAAGPQAELQRT